MSTAILGFCVSLVVYGAGEILLLSVTKHRLRSMPTGWREHPALAPAQTKAISLTFPDILFGTWQQRRTLVWFACALLGFAILWLAKFGLVEQLGLLIGVSAYLTLSNRVHRENAITRTATTHGLIKPPRMGARDESVWLSSRFVPWLGYLGCACFLADAFTRPFR